MPVTAKLSRKFYDMLGDDVANELGDWFNAVDLTYRTGLRELNDLNHARFEARLAAGLAGLRADLERLIGEVSADGQARSESLQSELKADLAGLRSEVKRDIAECRMATEAMGAQLRLEMAGLRADLIKWMFLFWVGTVAVGIAARFL